MINIIFYKIKNKREEKENFLFSCIIFFAFLFIRLIGYHHHAINFPIFPIYIFSFFLCFNVISQPSSGAFHRILAPHFHQFFSNLYTHYPILLILFPQNQTELLLLLERRRKFSFNTLLLSIHLFTHSLILSVSDSFPFQLFHLQFPNTFTHISAVVVVEVEQQYQAGSERK